MHLIDCEVGTWFRSPHWSEFAVAELVEEVDMHTGLVRMHVHTHPPSINRPSAMRPRYASPSEMHQEWTVCERPEWVTVTDGIT